MPKRAKPGDPPKSKPRPKRAAHKIEHRPLRYIFVHRPRCPYCASVDLETYRTTDYEDSLTRYVRCRACSARALLVVL